VSYRTQLFTLFTRQVPVASSLNGFLQTLHLVGSFATCVIQLAAVTIGTIGESKIHCGSVLPSNLYPGIHIPHKFDGRYPAQFAIMNGY